MSDTPDPSDAGHVLRIDALGSVRRHPEWFFRSGKFNVVEMNSLLMREANLGGATAFDIRTNGSWVAVSADVDWLGGDVAAFYAPISYPEAGRNSSRVEVVLTAFCDGVATAVGEEDALEIFAAASLSTSIVEEFWTRFPHGRWILFKPPLETVEHPDAVVSKSQQRPLLRLVQGDGEREITAAVDSFIEKVDDA